MSNMEFSVCQFFVDGTHEYVRRFTTAEDAMSAFRHYASSVAAKLGMTVRVIITDGGDHTNLEWKLGEGITYPPELVGRELKEGSDPKGSQA